jgi:hypothetical protein
MTTRFVVVGCGHTGTTLLSGIMHISGFKSIGTDRLFESRPLVSLNKRLLDGADQGVYADFEAYFQTLEAKTGGRWCIKDPRLSLAMHDIYPLVPQPFKVLYNFRDPRNTVTHLIKPRQKRDPQMSKEKAMAGAEGEWMERNLSVLRFLDEHPEIECLMVNYDDLVDGKLGPVVDRFVGQRLNYRIISPGRRKSPPIQVDDRLMTLYEQILTAYRANLVDCLLAGAPLEWGCLDGPTHWFQYRAYRLMRSVRRLRARAKSVAARLLPGGSRTPIEVA